MLIRILDGANPTGRTKIYVEEDEEGIIRDFGFNYAKASQFFQKYLKKRLVKSWLTK